MDETGQSAVDHDCPISFKRDLGIKCEIKYAHIDTDENKEYGQNDDRNRIGNNTREYHGVFQLLRFLVGGSALQLCSTLGGPGYFILRDLLEGDLTIDYVREQSRNNGNQ